MSLEVHPILDAGVSPKPGMWYAVSPEGGHEPPSARVGASAMEVVGAGTIWLCGGATLDGAFSDLFELKITSGECVAIELHHRPLCIDAIVKISKLMKRYMLL